MQRLKGFSADVVQDTPLDPGFHEPDLRGMAHAVPISGEVEVRHIDALESGRPVVPERFYAGLQNHDGFIGFPDKTIESRRSAHAVGFGRLALRGVANESGISVATKPFHDASTSLNELRGYTRLEELGMKSYVPIGVFPAKNGDHFVAMTRKQNDLMSLDRELWVPGLQPETEADVEVAQRNDKIIKGIAGTMARIHGNGIFHPDGQIKNWAINPEEAVRVIDTEKLVEVPIGHPNAEELAWRDIDKLTRSLIADGTSDDPKMFGVGAWSRLSLPAVRSHIQKQLVEPYIDTLDQMREQVMVDVGHDEDERTALQKFDYYDRLEAGIKQHLESNPDWPGHFIHAQRTGHRSGS